MPVMVMVGAVLSSLTVRLAEAQVPATSQAVPGTVVVPSALSVVGLVQVAIPEPPVLSVHVKLTVTSALFQPAALAAGLWLGVIVGAVRSIFTCAVFAASALPALSTLQNLR